MKLLITGREGQLARGLLEAGARAGVEVVAVGRPKMDITDRGSVAAVVARERPDVVVNAAAYTAVDKAEAEPAAARAVNALGAAHVAEACAGVGIPIIHISTDFVFDGVKNSPYRESDPTGPTNVYGRTKLEGEQRVAAICPRHVILRTAWVHSPWGNNFVKTMLRLAATRPQIGVVDDQLGTPTYAPELAGVVLAAASRIAVDPDNIEWGIYHAAGGGETTWFGLACEIFQCAAGQGLPAAEVDAIATSAYPTPARRPANSRLNCDRLLRSFGLELPDWRPGVRDCVARLAESAQRPHS